MEVKFCFVECIHYTMIREPSLASHVDLYSG